VVPVGKRNSQVMKIVTRISETDFIEENRGGFVFVPLIKGTPN
jgi:protein-L-isoaspartate(D-aspartate) O-methyltransferase